MDRLDFRRRAAGAVETGGIRSRADEGGTTARFVVSSWTLTMQHFLYFLPLPHGQGSLRPTFMIHSRIVARFDQPYARWCGPATWRRSLSGDTTDESNGFRFALTPTPLLCDDPG